MQVFVASDQARRNELRGDHRVVAKKCCDDLVPVDGVGDRSAHEFVFKGWVGLVHRQVADVEVALGCGDLEVGVVFNRHHVVRREVDGDVDTPCLQFGKARRRIFDPAKDQALDPGALAPVVFKALQGDLIAVHPLDKAEGSGPDRADVRRAVVRARLLDSRRAVHPKVRR